MYYQFNDCLNVRHLITAATLPCEYEKMVLIVHQNKQITEKKHIII